MHPLRAVVLALLALAAPSAVRAANAPPRCAEMPGFHELDFWLGDWEVRSGETLLGTNRIVPILDGCAVREQWSSVSGGHGESLFYHLAATGEWKQVWVTARAVAPGGVKEKRLVDRLADGSLRFQGEIAVANGSRYLDRTTLTPLDDDRVRQLIEVSLDGESWTTTFDAIYSRHGTAAAEPDATD